MTWRDPLESLPLLDDIVAEQCRRSYARFVREAWPHTPHLTGVKYVENWHVTAICKHLEAVARGDLRYLIVNQPPRSSKTELTGVFFLPWIWTWNPTFAAIFASVVASASTETSVRCRALIESPWYQANFTAIRDADGNETVDANGDVVHWELRDDKNAKNDFANTFGGSRFSTSVGAEIIGKGADLIVGDDLESDESVQTENGRARARTYWDGTLSSRAKDPATVAKILVQQRLHKQDMTWHLLKSESFVQLRIPTRFNPAKACETSIAGRAWRDPRTTYRELLNPRQHAPEIAQRTVDEALMYGTGMGPLKFAAQHDQDPQAETGGAFKRAWWRFYRDPRWPGGGRPDGCASEAEAPAVDLPRDIELRYLQSVDTAVKTKDENDATVSGVGATHGARLFLRDFCAERVAVQGMVDRINVQRAAWPLVRTTYVEDKASGPAVVQLITAEPYNLTGVVAVDPGQMSKPDRARLNTLPRLEAGQIFLPEGAPWLEYIVGEHAEFPRGEHDDSVDMLSQMLAKIGLASNDLDHLEAMSAL